MRPKPIPKAQSALIVPLLSTTNGLAYHRRRKQQTALQRRLMSTAKQESSVCKGKAKASAFFLHIRAVLMMVRDKKIKLFVSDSPSNLRSANFRSLIFRSASIIRTPFFKRKISNREFLLLFAVKK